MEIYDQSTSEHLNEDTHRIEVLFERFSNEGFTLADLESVPDAAWQEESWRMLLTNTWLNAARYCYDASDRQHNPLVLGLADFMRQHNVLVPSASIGKLWTKVFSAVDANDFWKTIEQFQTEDPIDDPELAVGFFLVEGVVSGHQDQVDAMIATQDVGRYIERIPIEFTTRRLVNLLSSGKAAEAIALVHLTPNSIDGLRSHLLFPKCLEQFFSSIISEKEEAIHREAWQVFGQLLKEHEKQRAAALAVWQTIHSFNSSEDPEAIVQKFGLDEEMLMDVASRYWLTYSMFDYETLRYPSTAKEAFEHHVSQCPKIRVALEDALVHHFAKMNMCEHWEASPEAMSDRWVKKIITKARHKQLCWSLECGRIDDAEHRMTHTDTDEEIQREYHASAMLGFREVCLRGKIEEIQRLCDLGHLTQEETSRAGAKFVKELLTATYFTDAKRLADHFNLSEKSLETLLADANARFLHDGDVTLTTEMFQAFGLPSDTAPQEYSETRSDSETRHEAEPAFDVLHQTVRFYVNESLIQTGKKIQEMFTSRGLSVPFQTAIAFEPAIRIANLEIGVWEKHIRELLLKHTVIEMMRNQHQVEDPDHTIVADYDNANGDDADAWRTMASDTDIRRVLRQSILRYGLTGWWSDRGGMLWKQVSETTLGLFSPPFPNTRAVDDSYNLVHHHGTFLVEPEDIAAVILDIKREAKNALDMLNRCRHYMDAQVFTQLHSRLSLMKEAKSAADRALAGY